MTKYVSAEDMAKIVKNSGSIPGSSELLHVLSSWTSELISVSSGPVPRGMLSTYEIRLDRSTSGEGPRVIGLSDFVEVIRRATSDIGMFSVVTPSVNYVGLLDETGSILLALASIFRENM